MRPDHLTQHKKSKHEEIHYMCDQCDYSTNQSHQLTGHKKSIHEGTRYFCDQCDYCANWPDKLTQHKNTSHEVVKYNQGGYLNTTQQKKRLMYVLIYCDSKL